MRIHILERSHTNANFVRKDFCKKITLFVINVYLDMTRSIGIILSQFHSGSMQNYQNFIYNYCVLKTKIKYLVS